MLLTWFVLTVLGAVVSFVRLPAGSRNLLWAEDGRIFVTRALQANPLAAFVEPYAGYMHAFPRFSALISVWVAPLNLVPVTVVAMACLLTGSVAAVIVVVLRARMPFLPARLVIWLAIVLLPVAGIEVDGSIANSHWYLLIGLFVILMTRQQQPTTLVLAGVTVFFAVLSDPLSGIFIPLVAVQLLTIRQRRNLFIPLIYLVGLAIQLSVTLQTHLQSSGGTPSVIALARATAYRVFLGALVGQDNAVTLYEQFHLASLSIAVIVVVGIVAWTVVRGHQLGGLAAVSLVGGVLFFLVAVWIRWLPLYDPVVSTTWGGSRYSVVPVSLIIVALGSALSVWHQRYGSRLTFRVASIAVAIALVAIIAIPTFSATTRHARENWQQAISSSQSQCAHLPGDQPEVLPISPVGWVAILSCGTVEAEK